MSLKNWTQKERPGQWPLTGARVVLEPLDWTEHGDGLYQAVGTKAAADTWNYMPIGPFQDQEEFQSVFEKVREALRWETLIIRRAQGGEVLGMASFMRIREAHGSAEVGCVAFGHALRRTPEATEAMYLMALHMFDELSYRRYEWKCHNENAASRRAAERFGFAFEGVFRNDMVIRGKNRDTAWFAMIDADWPAIKRGFEAWLKPKNFDAAGQQKKTLEQLRK